MCIENWYDWSCGTMYYDFKFLFWLIPIIVPLACGVKLILLKYNINNSPKCEHYGEVKKYIDECDMWLCKECEDEFKIETDGDK